MTVEKQARSIVEWVKTWRTWSDGYDEQAAFEAVLARLEEVPDLVNFLRRGNGNSADRKQAREIRYALGIVAIEAARDALPNADAVRAEQLASYRAAKGEEWLDKEAHRLWRQLEVELFLVSNLFSGPMLRQELVRAAEAEGISVSRLQTTRDRLGVISLVDDQRLTYWGFAEEVSS